MKRPGCPGFLVLGGHVRSGLSLLGGGFENLVAEKKDRCAGPTQEQEYQQDRNDDRSRGLLKRAEVRGRAVLHGARLADLGSGEEELRVTGSGRLRNDNFLKASRTLDLPAACARIGGDVLAADRTRKFELAHRFGFNHSIRRCPRQVDSCAVERSEERRVGKRVDL